MSTDAMNALAAQVQNAPVGKSADARFAIVFHGLEIRELHKDNPLYSAGFIKYDDVSWENADYGTVVAVQQAMAAMTDALNQLGAAKLAAINAARDGGAGNGGNGRPPVVPGPRVAMPAKA